MRLIMLPMLFGSSRSFEQRAEAFHRAGHDVQTIDIYEGQKVKQPEFLSFMLKNKGSEAAIDDLALSLNEAPIFEQIDRALLKWDNWPSALIGTSIGGSFAIRFAQCRPERVSGVVATSARLVYPESWPVEKREPEPSEVRCPLLLSYGLNESRKLMCGRKLDGALPRSVKVLYYPGGHGFTERFVQGWFLNPYYNGRSAKEAWEDIEGWLEHEIKDNE